MRTLTRNWGYKSIAVVAASVLWYNIAGESELSASVPISVRFENAPPHLELSTEAPERLFLKLRGPASRLIPSELASTAIVLNLANVKSSGEQTVNINRETLSLPAGVTLLRAVPSQLRLRFEKRASKSVPVEPRYSGKIQPGYRIAGRSVRPATVEIVGPESRVNEIQFVQTDSIDLGAAVGGNEFRVNVFTPDPHVRLEDGKETVIVKLHLENTSK